MEWRLVYGYIEEIWEARWIVPVLQLIMAAAIVVIGIALNMIIRRTWLEDTPYYHPINAKEATLCTGDNHSFR